MEHPEFLANLHRVDHAKGIALEPQRDLEHAGAQPVQGLCNVGLASSNSFLAALNQETGRVSRVIGGPLAAAPLTLTLSYLTTIVNKTRQRSEESLLGFAPVSRCCFKLRCSLID